MYNTSMMLGGPINCSGTMANALGKINPFRYRGYVYEEETGLYYLRNRYFNATICRFFNEDVLVGNMNLLSTNMYAYCLNKPIVFVDHTGTMATAAAELLLKTTSIMSLSLSALHRLHSEMKMITVLVQYMPMQKEVVNAYATLVSVLQTRRN